MSAEQCRKQAVIQGSQDAPDGTNWSSYFASETWQYRESDRDSLCRASHTHSRCCDRGADCRWPSWLADENRDAGALCDRPTEGPCLSDPDGRSVEFLL